MKDLPKRKLGSFSRSLVAAQASFRAAVEKLAEEARAEILPYFRAHDLDYVTGNGTWYISRLSSGAECLVEDSDLPANIRALLELEVGYNDYLGFYIRDILREGG